MVEVGRCRCIIERRDIKNDVTVSRSGTRGILDMHGDAGIDIVISIWIEHQVGQGRVHINHRIGNRPDTGYSIITGTIICAETSGGRISERQYHRYRVSTVRISHHDIEQVKYRYSLVVQPALGSIRC